MVSIHLLNPQSTNQRHKQRLRWNYDVVFFVLLFSSTSDYHGWRKARLEIIPGPLCVSIPHCQRLLGSSVNTCFALFLLVISVAKRWVHVVVTLKELIRHKNQVCISQNFPGLILKEGPPLCPVPEHADVDGMLCYFPIGLFDDV